MDSEMERLHAADNTRIMKRNIADLTNPAPAVCSWQGL